MADAYEPLWSFNVELDGCSKLFIKPDCSSGIENDRYIVTEQFHIRFRETKTVQSDITGYWNQLGNRMWSVIPQLFKNLLE